MSPHGRVHGVSMGVYPPCRRGSTSTLQKNSTQLTFNPLFNLPTHHRTRLPRNLFTILKEKHGRNTTDIKLRANLLPILGIQFGQPNIGFLSNSSFFKCRRPHFTGTTPGSPAINQYADFAGSYVFVKICRG